MTTPAPKYCATCKHVFALPAAPTYMRCRLSDAKESDDASLCGEMRKGACGPEATLWEAPDGEA